MSVEHASEIMVASAKVTPPVAVSAASLAGMPLQDWVFIATLLYTALLIAEKIHSWTRKRRGDGA